MRECLRRFCDEKPLILLDSASGIGLLEFRITINTLLGAPFLLPLDDVRVLAPSTRPAQEEAGVPDSSPGQPLTRLLLLAYYALRV